MLLLYIIIGLALLVLLLSMLAPRNYELERTVFIDRPLPEVYDYIRFLKNQNHWATWQLMDPDMNRDYIGEDGKIGFQSSWNSRMKNVGAGQQTITAFEDKKVIYTKLEFFKPFRSESDVYIRTEEGGNGATIVSWGFTGEMSRPGNVILLVLNMEKRLGKDFEDGLATLKNILEADKKPREEE